ncbi:SDR family oxidoreductase [Croceicoccus gelatinilyticus]|uniref:SDR family oxidoreductase n=1 Tax=Croceicoccus gelatinilyticus TaxID=2835536 RepID=UPI001BCDA131|nr:NmrA family NAD(P)-binding protein [Croceicoccus gelatinilyticus]MBS7668715.1 NmrA family NAD(P)-binding protein [Croceicoccus gelatinilyticus]
MTGKIAVIGATGVQGAAQVRELVSAGHDVLALSRSGGAVATPLGPVAGTAVDLGDEAGLFRNFQGCTAIFVNLPSTSFQEASGLIEAASRIGRAANSAGVEQIVSNTSMPVPAEKRGFAAQDARHDMRARLFESGVDTVSIEPVVYLDNLRQRWAWPSIVERGVVSYPHAPDLEVSWICHEDLARLMIAAIGRSDLSGKSIPVGGPETVRLPDLTARLSQGWGRKLDWRSQPIPEFCEGMRRAFSGIATLEAERLMTELRRIYEWYNQSPEKPFRVDMEPVLKLLPAKLTSIEEWARRNPLLGNHPIGG